MQNTSHKEGNCFHKTNKSVRSCESLLPAFTSFFWVKLLSSQILAVCALLDSIGFRITLTDFLSANAGTREDLLTGFSCTVQLIFTDSQRTKHQRQTQLGLSRLSVRVQSGPLCRWSHSPSQLASLLPLLLFHKWNYVSVYSSRQPASWL